MLVAPEDHFIEPIKTLVGQFLGLMFKVPKKESLAKASVGEEGSSAPWVTRP